MNIKNKMKNFYALLLGQYEYVIQLKGNLVHETKIEKSVWRVFWFLEIFITYLIRLSSCPTRLRNQAAPYTSL